MILNYIIEMQDDDIIGELSSSGIGFEIAIRFARLIRSYKIAKNS
jgi:hypothetical protein